MIAAIVGFIVWVIIVALMIWKLYVSVPKLAKENRYFSAVDEGKIKVVMKGGRAHHYIASIKGYSINPKTGEITPTQNGEIIPDRGIWDELFGVKFIGLPPVYTIYKYHFRWNKYITNTEGKHELVHKDEMTEVLYFRAPYIIEIPGLETLDRRQVTVMVQIVTETTNARLTLFSTPNWLSVAEVAVVAALRDYVAGKLFNDLLSQPKELGGDFVASIKIVDNEQIGNAPLASTIGQQLQSVSLISIQPDDRDAIAAMEKKKIESDLADAKEEQARGIEALGTADANNRRKMMNALGVHADQVGTLAIADAIKEAKPVTVVLGNGVMPTVSTDAKRVTPQST